MLKKARLKDDYKDENGFTDYAAMWEDLKPEMPTEAAPWFGTPAEPRLATLPAQDDKSWPVPERDRESTQAEAKFLKSENPMALYYWLSEVERMAGDALDREQLPRLWNENFNVTEAARWLRKEARP